LFVCACSAPTAPVAPDGGGAPDGAAEPDAPPHGDVSPLEVHELGVQGFVLRHGSDVVMTAPLFTRQSAIEVTFNVPLSPDTAAIDAHLAAEPLADISAIVSGHAHYDHFLDVPYILTRAPKATAYTNLTGRNILAALAPDRPATCTNAAPSPTLARDRVVAMDDAFASHVDYTYCPAQQPDGVTVEGTWLYVPGSHVRLKAFCSSHPAQVGPYHFGEGAIDSEQCQLPSAAAGWLEGQTLAFVIDFLDDTGTPLYRVFYQDAPTNAPIGHVPPSYIAEKAVDLAILCVGSADAVDDHPGQILANLQPRFALSGHWEDFFQPVDAPLQPIPLLNLDGYMQRAEAALPGRHTLAQPGSTFMVPYEP
jgi:L-ascorbate metabolism protein UlaG (beta-lactamase superfamily)